MHGNCWGVIDADYIGPIVVFFFNFSYTAIDIEKGERFCEVAFKNHPILREVENFDEDEAVREEGSFGSWNYNTNRNNM